jgi:hypothetical protein
MSRGDDNSRSLGGWGPLERGYIRQDTILRTAEEEAVRLGDEDTIQAWAEFSDLLNAQVQVAYFPTPVSHSGTPYKRFDVPKKRLASLLESLPLHFSEVAVDPGPFCEAMRAKLLK